MKWNTLLAVAVALILSGAAAFAQTPVVIPPGTTPPPPTTYPQTSQPATAAPAGGTTTGPGDVLARPPEAAVIAHGTAPELPPESAPLTNEVAGDEVQELVLFNDTPLPEAVNALALRAGYNIQFDPKLLNTVGPDGHTVAVTPPNVTLKWKNVTARQALLALMDNWGWQIILDPRSRIGRITVKDPAALPELVTTVVELQYGNPTNVLAEVQPTLSTRSSIISDARTHKLIIRTTEREVPAVEALITKLDSSTRQVLIEAKIIETTKDITSAKGVDWTGTLAAQHVSFGNGNTGGTTYYGPSSTINSPGTATTTTLPGGTTVSSTPASSSSSIGTNLNYFFNSISGSPSAGGGLSLNTAKGLYPPTAFLNADGVSAVLSFLNTDADTKTISFPRTVALDGVQTELMVVQNIPIFEQQQSAPAAGASQGLATVLPNYDKKVEGTILNEVGVKLTVLPRIAGPTNVLMDLRPEISQVDAVVASDTLDGQVSTSPIFDRRRITTQASVPTGFTLVLGGLESDTTTKTYTKVPFLGDIPGLGYAFRSDTKTHTKDTILIFVTPTIIRDADFQPGNSHFLKRKPLTPSDLEEPPWDTGKPYDWTKPKPGVAPAYQP